MNKSDFEIVKTLLEGVRSDLSDIKSNHLPHIYKRLLKLETRLAYYIGGAVALASAARELLNFL